MFCFLLLASIPVLFYVLLGLFIVLFGLQIFRLVLFEKQKKRFKKRMNKALSYQVDVDEERTKLYCKNNSFEIVDENNELFSIPNEENAKFVLKRLSSQSITPTKAIRVEIEFIKRDASFDGPFEIHFAPSDSFTDTWVLKEITSENEGIFEHPIMGILTLKKIPKSLKIGNTVIIRQLTTHYYQALLAQYKIVG